MNLENEFDELARRKLKEQEHPFEESHWHEAQRMIVAQRKGRGGRMIIGTLALLFLGTAAWWATRPHDASSLTSAAEQAAPKAIPHPTSSGSSSTAVSSTVNATRSNTLETPAKVSAASTSSHLTDKATTIEEKDLTSASAQVQRAGSGTRAPRTEARASTTTSVASTTPSRSSDQLRVMPSNTTASGTRTSGRSSATDGTVTPTADQVAEDAYSDPTKRSIVLQGTTAPKDTDRNDVRSDQLDPGAPEPTGAANDHGSGTTVSTANVTNEDPVDPSSTSDMVVTGPPADGTRPVLLDTTAMDMAVDTLLVDAPLPNDSMATTPAPVAAPPLVDPRAPWEISVLGGIRMNNTRYAGPLSDDQGFTSQGLNSSMFGAELMHLGRRFGVGGGLYHSSYAERLSVKERDVTNMTISPYWYLMPVDTTILFITDTLPGTGDTVTYVGIPVSTTINVLTRSADTTTTTERLREAREIVNRTSYLEVAALFDAHLVQGRWSMGVRGGPTFGILSGRKGTLPKSTNDGYVPFEDEAFRELVIGYQARAYLRYRWNAAWSIGLEPMIGGQLVNGLASGDLDRRSMAWGGLISLSYRLR